jgi:uncharacterized protein (UPF0335 family)
LRERTTEQNAALHATISDIAEQKQWAGKNLDVHAWKRLLTAAYERTQGRAAEVYPALDGAGFDVVYSRTSRMSKKELSEFMEYVTAWAIDNGVKLRAPESWAA